MPLGEDASLGEMSFIPIRFEIHETTSLAELHLKTAKDLARGLTAASLRYTDLPALLDQEVQPSVAPVFQAAVYMTPEDTLQPGWHFGPGRCTAKNESAATGGGYGLSVALSAPTIELSRARSDDGPRNTLQRTHSAFLKRQVAASLCLKVVITAHS